MFTALPKGMEAAIPSLLRALSPNDKQQIADDLEAALTAHASLAAMERDYAAEGMEGGAAAQPGFSAALKMDPTNEELAGLDLKELYTDYLGLPSCRIPGLFENMVRPDRSSVDRWSSTARVIPADDLVPLNLDHRQVVGVVRKLMNAFKGHPIINSDDVGVGKTFQVLAVVAVLKWFAHYFDEHHQYPGAYFRMCIVAELIFLVRSPIETGEMSWPPTRNLSTSIPSVENIHPSKVDEASPKGYRPIPRASTIITVPVPLLQTWIEAVHKLMKPTAFTLIPYEVKKDVMEGVWSAQYDPAAATDPRSVIVLATTMVRALITGKDDSGSHSIGGQTRLLESLRLPG
jgi:hypothetical protein